MGREWTNETNTSSLSYSDRAIQNFKRQQELTFQDEKDKMYPVPKTLKDYINRKGLYYPTNDYLHISEGTFAVSSTDAKPLKFAPALKNCLGLIFQTQSEALAVHVDPYGTGLNLQNPSDISLLNNLTEKKVDQFLSVLEDSPLRVTLISSYLGQNKFHNAFREVIMKRIPQIQVSQYIAESAILYPKSNNLTILPKLH